MEQISGGFRWGLTEERVWVDWLLLFPAISVVVHLGSINGIFYGCLASEHKKSKLMVVFSTGLGQNQTKAGFGLFGHYFF